MSARLDVVAIGNALVDVLSHESYEFLADHQLTAGAMELIDTPRAELLYAAMGPAVESSGGSAANTLVGIASLGGSAAFIGRVADDQLGAVFGHDIRAAGAAHGQELDEAEFRQIVEPLGRTLAQRTTVYGRTQTVGRRLRPPDEQRHGDGGDTPVVLLDTGAAR